MALGARQNSSVLFKEGTVISFDDATETVSVLRNASVLVTGDRIAAIFGNNTAVAIPENTEVIPAEGKIISPGFVDTHRHSWQTALKTLGSNVSLAEYLFRFGEFSQAGSVFTPSDVYLGQLAGLYEALDSGVTTILDHAHHTWSEQTSWAGLNASIDSGARIFWCYAIHPLNNGFTFDDQVNVFRQISDDDTWKGSNVEIGLAYDYFGSGNISEIESVIKLAREANVSAVTSHYIGGPFSFLSGPVAVNNYGFLNTSIPIVFSHASYLSVEDAELLRSTNQYVSINSESEMHYGHDHRWSHLIQDQAALGVDTHFTYSSDIVGKARMWLQETRLQQYRYAQDNWEIARNSPMSVNEAFLLATRAGGLALRRSDIGVLRVGAKADIVVFDGETPNMLGWFDPVAAIILHSHVSDIRHVMVNGQFKKRDGQLVNSAWPKIKKQFLASAKRIQNIWLNTPPTPLIGSYPYSSGILYDNAPTEDVIRGQGTGY
ncbi:hypothetical protein BZG36_03534 [Bifiguratus adelaidae]|uniref:Amidohydrolase-related domain-containing protein n=1 Tax=Bifiguratus adelaidae TaxID=1938954 RepID=A0A261XZA9_9FUNG|nr:hypothetical protein BZG36_03534 [Bifiguratus adelaidae]